MYTIQTAEYGTIIRNSKGDIVSYVATENEAYEYIQELEKQQKENRPNYVQDFQNYCKNMPGKCYIDGKLMTQNRNLLERYLNQFLKDVDVDLHINFSTNGGETFYFVEE